MTKLRKTLKKKKRDRKKREKEETESPKNTSKDICLVTSMAVPTRPQKSA